MSVLEFITNRYILTLLCAVLVFGEMFVLKRTKLWFGNLTANIKDTKAKTAVNLIFGVCTCFALAAGQMYALCDVLPGAVFAWRWVILATFCATCLYLMIEKVFGNAITNKLGNVLADYISRSNLFDGKISESGMIAVAEKLLEKVTNYDKSIADKEKNAIDEVCKRLDGFLEDGKVTAEEKSVASELINTHNIDVNSSVYERYKSLLK